MLFICFSVLSCQKCFETLSLLPGMKMRICWISPRIAFAVSFVWESERESAVMHALYTAGILWLHLNAHFGEMILDLAVFDPFWHVFVMQPVHTDSGRDKCVRVYVCERESFATLSFSWLLKAVDWILSSYISVALASVAGCAVISVRAVTAAGDTVERVKIWPASSITSTWAPLERSDDIIPLPCVEVFWQQPFTFFSV